MVMIADGGGSVRVPVNLPNPVNQPQQPASSPESDAAARARELQRQLEALLEKLREAQRQAEEARKRAIEAQRKAQEAKAHAEAMEAQAQKSRDLKDADKAKKAQQDSVLQDARAKKASAEANLKDKDVDLLGAQVEQKREQKKSPEAKASAEIDKKVQDAQTHRDEAQRTNELSALYADAQEKEGKAQAAEAKALELTPPPSKPQSVISDDERTALSSAQKNATTLRGEADAATQKFTDAVGADVQTEFYGAPVSSQGATQPASAASGTPQMPADAMHSPLLQLLQVQPRSGLDALGGNRGPLPLTSLTLLTPTTQTGPLQAPTTLPSTLNGPVLNSGGNGSPTPLTSLFQPKPTAMTPELSKTLSSIAEGKTVDQIAKDRNIGIDKVIAEANSAGIRIETTKPSTDVQVTTVKKGDASVSYTNDYHSGSLSVKGSFADAKAPDGRRTVQATQDGNGLLTQTVKDEKTGKNVTQTVDVKAGTRIETSVDADGRRTETTTSLTGAPVLRPVGQYEDYLDVAKAANITPDQLFALNPKVDYGVALKPGQQMVVAGVETTVKTYSADGSVLEKTIASDGTLQVVNTTASGHRVVLMGEPEAKTGPGEQARKAIFDDKMPIAEVAKSLNLTEEQVLASLPPGTVDVKKPTSDNGEVETRTIYDPSTNRTVVEYHDWKSDSISRKVIDEKTVFKVQGHDDEGKPAVVELSGGAGYAQKQADDALGQVGDYNKQIGDLDKLLRDARRMGDTLPEEQARRRNLVDQRDAAQDRADIAQSKATSTLTQYKQTVIDKNAGIAYQRQAVARPGSKEQAAATADLNDMLGRTDKIDRLVVAADKDVDLVEARIAKDDAHDAKLLSDQNLQTEFEKWKRNWRWGGLDEKEIQKREAQGVKPVGPQYRNAEEENEAAWRDFKKGQGINDERFGNASTNGEVPWHDAWVNRNKASDAEQLANLNYDKASIAQGNADAHVIAGDVARLQEKKDAWTKANPTLFSESFAQQGDLDTLTDQFARKKAGVLQDGQRKDYTEFIANASAPDREEPEELKKLQDKFNNDNAGTAAAVDRQVKDILLDRTRRQAKASEDYINLWPTRNTELQKQLDGVGSKSGTGSVRAAERRAQDLLDSSEQGRQLQNARNLKSKTFDELTKVSVEDDKLLDKDYGDLKKSQEGHTWLRDIFDDSADEAVQYTKEQRDQAKKLKDQLATGEISLTKYTEEEDKLMDAYSVKAVDITREQRDNDEFWSVVDEAARIGVSTLAGIAATVATGGNVAAGIAAGVAVNELWDTTGDIVAAAQGRDIYADGHTSMWTATYKAANGDLSWDDVKFTLKDEAVDIASSAVGATGVGAGMRTGAAFSAKYALREGVVVPLKLGQRASVGVRAGLVSQAVDGAGRVGVETMSVGLDGQLGSAEGDKRIWSTMVSSAMGVVTAPATGAFSAVMPLPSLAGGVLSKTKFAGAVAVQFGNDLGGSMGTGQLISLANYGRGMNDGELRAAWIQAFPGTVNNIGVHPFMARKAAAAQEQQQQQPEPPPQQHADDAAEAKSAADEAADPVNAVDASNAGNAANASNPGNAMNAANAAANAADGDGGSGGANAGQGGETGNGGNASAGSPVDAANAASASDAANAANASNAANNGNVKTGDLADHAGQDMDNLVVLDAGLNDLAKGGDIPLRAARALSPGGMVEFRVTLDAQNAASGAGADGGIKTAGFSSGTQGRARAADGGVARKGDESQAARDSEADQDVAIRHRMRAAGFENVTINREMDLDTGRVVLVVQAHKAGPDTLDGGLPLRSRPVPRGDGMAKAGDDAGEYTLPPPSSDAHTNGWSNTLKAILQSGGRIKDSAFYLHGRQYDADTGLARSPSEHGLAPAEHGTPPAQRQAAYAGSDSDADFAGLPPARYGTLDEALTAAQAGGTGMRGTDGIALVFEPLLRPDGSVPPEAVLATLGIDKNGAEPAKLATVAPNRHSDTAETQPLKVSYPTAAPRNKSSGLILPGGTARPTHLTVPDDATVYFTDKSGRVKQISVDDPRVAAALERAEASRARLLALPSREQGLDVEGVQAWMEAQGMKPVDLRLVDAGSVPHLWDNEAGRYLGRDGVALVARDPVAKGPQGVASVERTIVHEAAHGNENKRGVFILHEQTDPQTHRPVYVIEPVIGLSRFDPKLGQVVGMPGEEGYAARKSQQYMESRTGPMKAGLTFEDQVGRYVEGDGMVDHGAFTAVTLDALVRMNPKLEGLMERARFSSAAHDELIATMGKTLEAINGYRGTDLTTPEYQARAEAIYDAVQNNGPLPSGSGKAPPSPGGPAVTLSRPVQRAAAAGADGLPLKPSAFGTEGDWMAAALKLEDTVAQQRAAGQGDKLPPGMIVSDADKAVTQALMKDPEPGSGECFIVSGRPPSQGIFAGGDVRAKRADVHTTLDKALEAAARHKDGAWIYRAAPEGGIAEMTRFGKARSHNILGAFHANADKTTFEVGIANPQFDRWDLSPAAPSIGRAHVYNASLTMPVGRPAEGIFRQGGIEEGADAAIAALDRAVAEGRKPSVMIAAGYSIASGRAETSGPGGAAVAGKAVRLYASQVHGEDVPIVYVAAGRSQRKVLTAALEALGERKGEHYEIVSFNARGKRAEWRSGTLLNRHQPDLLMGFDVPGRTERGDYRNSHGREVGYHTPARDQLFIDAMRRDSTTTVAGLDLGNEVGGGHPDVHTRVQTAADGTPIASIVTADVAMTGGRTNWVGYAFGTEVLRRGGALSAVPDETTVRGMVMKMMKAGGIDSETGSRVPFKTDERGRKSGVGGMSPDVEAAVAAMLRVRAEKIHMAPSIDLRGVRLRLGVFDSGSGGIIAAAEIKRVVEETTGARVDLVMVGDHGAGTYGGKPKASIADHTRAGLETLDKLGVDLIVMACNTACTSGKGEYARGINAPVIDLIDSTRGFHKGLVQQGERVVAFSTEASAKLPLPGHDDVIGVYRDKNVLPVGGTDEGFDMASIVNRYMADPMDPAMRTLMQDAADHYANKILTADPEVSTVSWCCTHYPELEPFFVKSLEKPEVRQGRGAEQIKLVNPMTHQSMKAIEVAQALPPGTGAGPSRAIGITTAVADKQKAIDGGLDPKRAEVSQAEVLDTLRIALQRDDVTLVPLERLGSDVDVEAARAVLSKDEAGDPIDALQAFDPSGRGFPIHVPGGAYAAAKTLGDAGKVVVVAGFPIRTAGGRVAPESDSTKGAAVLAASLAKLGKDATCITMPSNVKPLKAALAVLGRDDIDVQAFGLQVGPHAKTEALRMLRDLDPDALVSVEAPGRDAQGEYWSSTGERITADVAALDEFFYAARDINAGRGADASKIAQIAILDVGNEVGGGSVDKRVRRAPDGQRIASEVTADQLVTAGVGSWGADATVAALEVAHGGRKLLPTAAEVPRVMQAIAREGGVDSQSRTGIDAAAGYGPTVHVGMTELYRQAAQEVRTDRAKGADGSGEPPKSGTARPAAAAEPMSAAFRGDEWPDVYARLIGGGFGNDNVYVYRVKGQPDLYADPAAPARLTLDQIDGNARVARGTDTVRWYGDSTPGKGLGGLMPRREMGAKFGLEPKEPKETVYRIKNRETGEITRQTDKPTDAQYGDSNLRIRTLRSRPPREASPQPVEDWFIVSNQSPARVKAVNGLSEVTRGDSGFTLPSIENAPKPPGGWPLGKVIRRQITVGVVAAVGITTANAISPIDTGHDVPTGIVSLPRNPIAATSPHQHQTPAFQARPEAFSVPAEVTLGMAQHQQRAADALARQQGHDPAAARALQATADGQWGAFSAEMLKAIRGDVQAGANPVAAANRQRAQLIALDRLDVHSDAAVRNALRDSGLLKGTTADVQAQMDYAHLVAEHPALVNDKSRELARLDPAGFAAATLLEIGPDAPAYKALVDENAGMLGRLHSEGVVKDRLADGDLAGAVKEASVRLDVSRTQAERDKAAAGLRPLFDAERTRALDLLDEKPMHDVGDYLAQYRDAPPEISQPVARGVLDLMQRNLPRASDDLASMTQFEKFVEGLSIVAESADARSPTSAFSERFATELLNARFAERPEFTASLQRAVADAVEQGGTKLPVELANALETRGNHDLRDNVLAGIDKGVKAQEARLGEAMGNLRGDAGYNATGASMAFYVAHFSDRTPQGAAAAIAQYRRVNPGIANKVDEATRVVGDWGLTLAKTHESLNGLRVGKSATDAEKGLEGTLDAVYNKNADVTLAMAQSPRLRQDLMSRSAQGVVDPRTMTEYLINPVMFVTRHVSGTTRMVWSMVADAQFNNMVMDPGSYAKRWDAFKLKTENMAKTLGLNADEVRQGTALVDEYVAKAAAVDANLPDSARIDAFARLGAEFDGKLQKLLGVGAKTVNNVTNANTAFGQVLRWVANAGFVTHNVSTELTNLRPLADGVQDYTQWYHRIYAPTQAFFMAKPYTTLMAERSLAGNRTIDGAAADIEGKMAWKYVFGLGTAGVGVADLSLAVGQAKTVPTWVTFTNVGMGVGGVVDGGVGLINVTGAALTRVGAVELGALLAIPAEAATIGGLGVAVFTGIKQFYNIAHHYDQVDAREAQRDAGLRNVLKDSGFSDEQTRAMLDCTHEGVSPMVAWNALMKSQDKTVDEGMQMLRERLGKDGPQGIPANEWVKVMHGLTDDKMNDNDGSFPGSDPNAAQAGQTVIRYIPTKGGAVRSESIALPQSIEGLENYARAHWHLDI